MRRSEMLAGLAMLVVAAALGVLVLVSGVPLLVPVPVWGAGYVLVLVLAVAALWGSPPRPGQRAALLVAVLASWAVCLTVAASGMDFLSILLVFLCSAAVYVVRVPWVLAILMGNLVVVALRPLLYGSSVADTLILTIVYGLIQATAVLSSMMIMREQRLRQELTVANIELAAASTLLAESARSSERLRIARDLHDALGHQLTVLNLELEVARHRSGAEAEQHVHRAGNVARELLAEVRQAVGQWRTEPGDLRRALLDLTAGIPGLDISVSVAADVRLGEPERDALVRAAQEILTNTIRHSDATEIVLEVTRPGDRDVLLRACDNGAGAAEVVPGNGLTGMTERIEALGGQVRLEGGRGFEVTAQVPVR